MEFQEVLRSRRSIRSYKDVDVDDATVGELIRAAMLAPSAGNQQPWHFLIIRDPADLAAIPSFHLYSKMVVGAPVAVLVCGDPHGKKWPDYWPQDCSAATQNILLAARDKGLGTVWAGVFPDEVRMAGFRSLFGIPDTIYPFSLIPIGWPDSPFQEVDRFRPDLVHYGMW